MKKSGDTKFVIKIFTQTVYILCFSGSQWGELTLWKSIWTFDKKIQE